MTIRGYSRAFPTEGKIRNAYLLDRIPSKLWTTVKKRCKRDGVSIRAAILSLLTEWAQPRRVVSNPDD